MNEDIFIFQEKVLKKKPDREPTPEIMPPERAPAIPSTPKPEYIPSPPPVIEPNARPEEMPVPNTTPEITPPPGDDGAVARKIS